MVEDRPFLIQKKPVISTGKSFSSKAPTYYDKPTFKPDTSSVSDTVSIQDYARDVSHESLAFKTPDQLVREVEQKRQMSLSPNSKKSLLSFQKQYQKSRNIQPPLRYEVPDRKAEIIGQEQLTTTRAIRLPRESKPEIIIGSIVGGETVKTPSKIAQRYAEAVGKEFKKEYTEKKTLADKSKLSSLNIAPSFVRPFIKGYTEIDPDVSAYLEQKAYEDDESIAKNIAKETGIGVARAIQGVASPLSYVATDTGAVIKATPSIIKSVPGIFKSELAFAKKFPQIALTEFATGTVLDELLGDPVGKAVSKGVSKVKKSIVKMSTDYKPVTINPFGYEEIKGIKGLSGKDIDIVLVPGRGQSKPKLNVDAVVDDFGRRIPLTDTPKLPTTTNKKLLAILDTIKNTDNIVSGSYSQQALLKKKFTRPFKDLDIGSPDVEATVKDIVKAIGEDKVRVLQQPTATTIIDIETGMDLADVVPLDVAEGGWVTKYKPIELEGIKLADPRSRLAGKSIALSEGIKIYKTVPDIESLIGEPGALSPLKSGRSGFGFSFAEQSEYVGKTGTLVSGQREIFEKGLFGTEFLAGKEKFAYKPSSVPLESSLFASPFDITTGKPLLRKTRLAVSSADNTANIWDLVSGRAEFDVGKQSQILLFENQKIADIPKDLRGLFKRAKSGDLVARSEFFKKYRKFQLEESPIFKPLGFEGSELEVTAYKPTIVKKGKLGTTVIDDTVLPIYSVELKGQTKVKPSSKVSSGDVFYHGTTKDSAKSIIKDGLKSAYDVKFTKGLEGVMSTIDPYQNRIFLTDSLDNAKMYSGGGDVVKIDLSNYKKKVISTDKYGLSKIKYSLGNKEYIIYKQGDLGEYYTLKNIKSSDLSIVGANDKNFKYTTKDIRNISDDFIDGSISDKDVTKLKIDLKSIDVSPEIIDELSEIVKKSKKKINTFEDDLRFNNILNRSYYKVGKPVYKTARLVKLRTARKSISEAFKSKNSAENYINKNSKSIKSKVKFYKLPVTSKTRNISSLVSSDMENIKRSAKLTRKNIGYTPIIKSKALPRLPEYKFDSDLKSKPISRPPIYDLDSKIKIVPRPPEYPIGYGGFIPKEYTPPILKTNGSTATGGIIGKGRKKSSKKKVGDVFGVEVRKSGVWSRVDAPGMRYNKNAALDLGIQETGNSPARSFRLVPVSGKANVVKTKPPKMLSRYYKKSGKGNRKLANAYIEKPKYAIDSQKEIQNITKVGWQTNRNLKKQRQKQNSMINKILGRR